MSTSNPQAPTPHYFPQAHNYPSLAQPSQYPSGLRYAGAGFPDTTTSLLSPSNTGSAPRSHQASPFGYPGSRSGSSARGSGGGSGEGEMLGLQQGQQGQWGGGGGGYAGEEERWDNGKGNNMGGGGNDWTPGRSNQQNQNQGGGYGGQASNPNLDLGNYNQPNQIYGSSNSLSQQQPQYSNQNQFGGQRSNSREPSATGFRYGHGTSGSIGSMNGMGGFGQGGVNGNGNGNNGGYNQQQQQPQSSSQSILSPTSSSFNFPQGTSQRPPQNRYSGNLSAISGGNLFGPLDEPPGGGGLGFGLGSTAGSVGGGSVAGSRTGAFSPNPETAAQIGAGQGMGMQGMGMGGVGQGVSMQSGIGTGGGIRPAPPHSQHSNPNLALLGLNNPNPNLNGLPGLPGLQGLQSLPPMQLQQLQLLQAQNAGLGMNLQAQNAFLLQQAQAGSPNLAGGPQGFQHVRGQQTGAFNPNNFGAANGMALGLGGLGMGPGGFAGGQPGLGARGMGMGGGLGGLGMNLSGLPNPNYGQPGGGVNPLLAAAAAGQGVPNPQLAAAQQQLMMMNLLQAQANQAAQGLGVPRHDADDGTGSVAGGGGIGASNAGSGAHSRERGGRDRRPKTQGAGDRAGGQAIAASRLGDGEKEKDDEISTIFVVGFPDDMTEREFQNMFTFSSGFEAAMLKVPHLAAAAAQEKRDREVALASGITANIPGGLTLPLTVQQQVASRHTNPTSMLAELHALQEQYSKSQSTGPESLAAAASTDPNTLTSSALEEALAAVTLQLGQTPATASSGASGNQGASGAALPPARRQTIGFARFRTRADALVARDILQGRKIDLFSGSALKAEMAKKNLHTKRGMAGEELVGMLVRSGRLPGLLAEMGMGSLVAPGTSGSSVADMTSGANTPSGRDMSAPTLPNAPHAPALSSRSSGNGENRSSEDDKLSRRVSSYLRENQDEVNSQASQAGDQTLRQEQLPHNQGDSISPPISDDPSMSNKRDQEAQLMDSGYFGYPQSGANPVSRFPDAGDSPQSVSARPQNSKALLALAEEEDELEGWRVGGVGMDQLGLESRGGTPGYPGSSQPLPNMEHQERQQGSSYGASPPEESSDRGEKQITGGNPDIAALIHQRTFHGFQAANSLGMKPPDQNPPINTLYVGNLPAAPAPSHPPNLLEDSLRQLFSQCNGFRRLSYRQKLTPQCFVEFADIPSATQAMHDLYGHTLNGLVRGGIRIAYSRNPLGQRGTGQFSPPQKTSPALFGALAAGGGSYIPIPLSPASVSNAALPFTIPNQSTSSGGGYRRPSESSSTPLSPRAAPFSSSLTQGMSTSPRFNQHHAIDGGVTPSSPRTSTVAPWLASTSPAGNFSAFDPFSGQQGSASNRPSE